MLNCLILSRLSLFFLFFCTQVLTTITNSTDMFVVQLDDHVKLIRRARENLVKRERRYFNLGIFHPGIELEPRRDSITSVVTLTESQTPDTTENAVVLQDDISVAWTNKQTRGATLAELPKKLHTSPHTSPGKDTKQRTSSFHLPNSSSGPRIGILHPLMRQKGPQRRLMESNKSDSPYLRRKNPSAIKNAIYAAVLLEEWLMELAAISLEHNLV